MAKILIMDDSALMRSVLRNFVKKEGHDVVESADGKDAIEKYKTEKPDMVFMDILVPGGTDGLTALKEIRAYDAKAKVVMVTSLKEKSDEETAKKYGASGYIMKPFSKDEIIKALKTNLG
jgi:two-component system, chemotaxis family, chemotaxis protein CheY